MYVCVVVRVTGVRMVYVCMCVCCSEGYWCEDGVMV